MFAGRTRIGTSRLLALMDSKEYPCAKMSIRKARTAQESAFKPPTPDKNTLPRPNHPPETLKNPQNKPSALNQEGETVTGGRFCTPPQAVPGTTPTFPPSLDQITLPNPAATPNQAAQPSSIASSAESYSHQALPTRRYQHSATNTPT